MATRIPLNYLDNLSDAPTGAGGDLIYDNINTLDAFLVGMAGGATGYVLAKSSASDHDFVWIPIPSALPDMANASEGDVLTVSDGSLVWSAPAVSAETTYSAGTGITISESTISVTPGTYASATHSHVSGDVSGLDSALGAKANATHTHASFDILGLAAVATTGSYTDVSGLDSALGAKANATHTHASSDISGLAAVATTGSFNDLSGVPTIPADYTLPVATESVLGGIKVGNGLVIDNGVLSTTGGTGGTTTAALSGLTDVVLSNPASGQALTYNGSVWVNSTISGVAGSNITPCSEIFTYWDENIGVQYTTSNSTPYPAEVAHKAGYAYCSAWANGAGYASGAYRANYADNATTAMTAYYISGEVASAQTAKYAIWAGPCYGEYTSGNVAYSNSKASAYESNGSDTGSPKTICPLPPIGPFIVDLLMVWSDSNGQYSSKYIIRGNNLHIDDVVLVTGDPYHQVSNCFENFSFSVFIIYGSKLMVNTQYSCFSCVYCLSTGCYEYICSTAYYSVLTSARVCGNLINNIC